MGTDKAALPVAGTGAAPERGGAPDGAALSLAQHCGRLLSNVCDPVLEAGPGCSGLPFLADVEAYQGPLLAMVNGSQALRQRGWSGPVMVIATDLPRLTSEWLEWLSDVEPDKSVVPVVDGTPQSLCARYSPADLEIAARVVARGGRSMREFLAEVQPRFVSPDDWKEIAAADVLADVDTPEEWEQIGARP